MISRFKQLGKDSIIYGIGGAAAKAVGFFLLPVYTRIFSPAEFGTIEMLVVINGFLGTFLVMGMDSAQSFFFFEQKKGGQRAQANLVSAVLQWRLAWGGTIVLFGTLSAPLLNKFFFNGNLSWEYFAIAFSAALFGQVQNQSAQVYRLLYKPLGYMLVTLGQTLLSAALIVLLVVVFNFGIIGYFCGMLVGAGVASICGWYSLRDYIHLKVWHKEWWPKLITFGAPFLPVGLAMYVLRTSDRWFINYYHGEAALGIYAIGAKFASIILIAVETFRLAWWPLAMDSMHSDDGPDLFRAIGRLYLGLGVAGVVFITTLSPILVRLFTAPAYHSAYPVVGILAWYVIFYGFILIASAGVWIKKKTMIVPLLSGIAALLNIFLDYLFVPKFGGFGAAIATSISFFIWVVLALIISEKLWYVGHNLWILFAEVMVGVIACTYILYGYSHKGEVWSVWLCCLVAIFILVLLSVSKTHRLLAWQKITINRIRL